MTELEYYTAIQKCYPACHVDVSMTIAGEFEVRRRTWGRPAIGYGKSKLEALENAYNAMLVDLLVK